MGRVCVFVEVSWYKTYLSEYIKLIALQSAFGRVNSENISFFNSLSTLTFVGHFKYNLEHHSNIIQILNRKSIFQSFVF